MPASNTRIGLLLLAFVTISALGCKHQLTVADRFGEEWRSMTMRERESYVGGFLDGHSTAQQTFCNAMDKELESIKFRPEVGRVDDPCKHLQAVYSHSDANPSLVGQTKAYVSAIDDFYKHPECRMIPYVTLLEHLNDKEYKSGEELYQDVRAGNVAMGFFSGFEGIENCYGVDDRNR